MTELLNTQEVIKTMPYSTMEQYMPHKGVVKPRIEIRKMPLEKSFDPKEDNISYNNEKPHLEQTNDLRKDFGYPGVEKINGKDLVSMYFGLTELINEFGTKEKVSELDTLLRPHLKDITMENYWNLLTKLDIGLNLEAKDPFTRLELFLTYVKSFNTHKERERLKAIGEILDESI